MTLNISRQKWIDPRTSCTRFYPTTVRGGINFCLPKCSHDTIKFEGIMTIFWKAEVDTPT